MNDNRPGAAGGGLFVSLRRLIGTALELGQVRLELLGTELEAQKIRILDGLIWAAFGVMCVGVGIVLLAACIVYLFGEAYRLQALALLTLAFLAGGVFAIRHARERLKTPPGAFAASVGELAQDRAALRGSAETPPP